jgi:uncharacterized membrane protein YoaK (UPF0700 family)
MRLDRLRPRSLWQSPSGPGYGPLTELLLILTMVTGLVDAVSILSLGRVFVANMTGNVVFAGFAIVGAPGFSLSASLFALGGFLVGAWGGGAMTTRVGHDRAIHLRTAAVSELALVAAALVIAAASGDAAASHGTLDITSAAGGANAAFTVGVTDSLAFLLAVAMGIQNSMARKLAVPDLTTTVLTMTLTGIGADPGAGQRGQVTRIRRLLVVATMLAGGVLGAWLVLNVSAVSALALATGLLAITAASAARTALSPAPWRPATPPKPPAPSTTNAP